MRLLILGTGGMAHQHARNFQEIDGVEIVAGVDVDQGHVDNFAAEFNVPNIFTSLPEAMAWGEFDAVANVTPDYAHHITTLQCLAAGKHVLCEKPLATDYHKALEMTEAAEKAGLVGMVNLTYRNVAELHKARQMVQEGKIGTLKHVEASYLQSWLSQPAWGHWDREHQWLWRLSTKHGSKGVLGDIGIHILDFMSFGANADLDKVFCRLQTFHKAPGDRIGEYDLDANDSFVMTVEFGDGALGVVHASRWATGHLNELRLRAWGDKGAIEVIHRHDGNELRACIGKDIKTATWKTVKADPVQTNYQRFAEAVISGETREPSFRHAANLQNVLDLSTVTDQERRERDAWQDIGVGPQIPVM